MTRSRALAFAVLSLTIPGAAAAQDPDAVVVPLEPYIVGEATPPATDGQALVMLTLEQALNRALESNLDVQSARLAPLIQRYALRAARAAFTPTISGNYGYNSSTNQSTSQLDGGAQTTSSRQTFNTSLAKSLPWYGGRLSSNFNNTRTETDNAFTTRNPSYNSSINLSYTQPLLAGLKTDNQRASIETSEIQGSISDLQLAGQIETILSRVRSSYWGLRATIEQIEIQRRSLAQAEDLLVQNQVLQRVGRATRFQVVQAEAQVASAQQSLLNAEIQWRNQELILKQLLLSGADDPLLFQTINPVDQPLLVAQDVDIAAATEVALRERTDIRQQRAQERIADVNIEVDKTNLLPTVNLTASYSVQGVGGDLFDRSGLGGDPILIERGGYVDGLNSIANREAPTWNLSLNASYPIGNNPAKSNLERSNLQMRQLQLSLRSQELQIVTQVTAAGLAVNNTFLQYQAAQRSRIASERNTEAEQTRFRVGIATNFELVTAQNALTSARLSELQALINHLNAISDFERVQRTGG